MKSIAILIALLLAPLAALPDATPANPNILFIMVDEMKWNVMSCAGHEIVKTPNLDRLAKDCPSVPVMTGMAPEPKSGKPVVEKPQKRNANPINERKQETLNNEK